MQQYDHTLVMESILYHQFPWLGNFANKYILPNVGELHFPCHIIEGLQKREGVPITA